MSEGDLEVEVATLDGAPERRPRQSRQRRTWRAVAVTCAMLAVVCVVLSGPASLLALATQTWQQIHDRLSPPTQLNTLPARLNASSWTAIRVPASPTQAREASFVPAANTSLVAYTCWRARLANAGTASTLSLYLTRDGARSWSPLDSPVAEATGCRFVVDVSQPQYALLLINASASGSCGAPQVFASDAWGASWHIVTLPHPLNTACAPGFFLANGHLYAWSQDSRYVNGGPPGSPLMVSAVGGATWSNAFATLSAAALPLILGAHVDGSLLVQVDVQGSAGTGPPVAPALWCRDGSTGRWSLLANAPETSQAVVVSADPAAGAGCAWAPIYAFSYFVDPGTGQASVTSIAVRHGTAWDGLPSLPVTGASGQQPLGDVGRVLGVGPAGTLLVDVPDASTTSDVSTPQRTIWGWDLGSGRWLRDYSDEPGIARVEGFSWVHTAAGPTAVLWVFGISLGLPPITGVFYATLAANPLAPAGNGSG